MSGIVMPMSEGAAERPLPQATTADLAQSESPQVRFRRMVDLHFDFIWRSLRGMGVATHSVDDAAQQVFFVASQKLGVITPGSERSFLFGTALGVAANARRARARNREVLGEAALGKHADGAPDAERAVELTERRALLDRVLAGMPEDLRAVFVLFVLEGLDTPQIATLLAIPRGTVASRLRRARETFHVLSKKLQAAPPRRGSAP
jgi:RNA polymerase sigma-70 factor (ECF subfamily)